MILPLFSPNHLNGFTRSNNPKEQHRIRGALMPQNNKIASIKEATENSISFSLGKQIIALWLLTILAMTTTLLLFVHN
ncbi:hypothetical protein HBZS_109350 [Helicobacter bizzozeronii CCUG 35545]|nr:hypothetical protein HBZS_109350 [Helicobacter bizzozeronii CCUG 35545]